MALTSGRHQSRHSRAGQSWRFEEIEGQGGALTLGALTLALPLAEIYDGLDLPDRDA